MSTVGRCALAVLVLAVASTASAKETFYRWVDPSGAVHYSKDAPPDVASAEVDVTGAAKEKTEADTSAVVEAPATEAADAKLDAAEAAICARARSSLRVLETERPVVRLTRDTGVQRVLSADEIAAELVIARKDVERTCAPNKAPTE